jgi:GNAT superfamily N-acetyltransferase
LIRDAPFAILPLDRDHHDRAAFACGNDALDRYLRQQAGQDARRRVAAVFVMTQPGETQVLGYYTLSQASVLLDALPPEQRKRLPRYPNVPVTLMGRLAVHRPAQGTGLGALLLGDACRRTAAVADEVASAGLLVDAIDDDATRFYERFGFTAFHDSSRRLFLPMRTISDALSRPAATSPAARPAPPPPA